LNNSTMTVSGHWTKTSGTFNAGNSNVTFTGSSNQNLNSGGSSFFNFTTNKAGGTLTLLGSLDVNGDFTKTLGTFAAGAFPISVAGDWSNSGTFTTGSTVTFDGSSGQNLIGSSTFYALRAITTNDTLFLTAGATQFVTSLVDLENISLRSLTDNSTYFFNYKG